MATTKDSAMETPLKNAVKAQQVTNQDAAKAPVAETLIKEVDALTWAAIARKAVLMRGTTLRLSLQGGPSRKPP